MSADPENEYFSDGITEEIINALTTVKGLKVIARTSSFAFKNKNMDVRTIGEQLGVNTVLEGSVRKAKNRVRITAQLISTLDGTHFWSKNFDRDLEDIFAVQDEISLHIADKIRENFGHLNVKEHLIEAPTHNIEAYDLYLKGRYQHLRWDGEGIRNSVELYEHCVTIDPSFALPYFGLAYSYAMYGSWGNNKNILQLSEENHRKGFKLDKQSSLGYFGKATLQFWGQWDFIEGHKNFQKALEINPSYTEAEEGLCELYTAVGYFEKALWHADNILRINPLSPNHYFTKANIHYLEEGYSKALECLDISLSINPDFTHSIALKQLCLILTKDYEKLNEFLDKTPLVERPEECRVLYKLVNPDEDIDIDISRASFMIKEDLGAALFPWQLFLLVHLGKHEMALDFLDENIKLRSGQIINYMNIPFLRPLNQYERFRELLQATFRKELLPPNPEIQITPPDSKTLMSDTEADMVSEKLALGMSEEKWFQNPSLSLRELADKVNTSSNKLSWLLNDRIGQNFNEYINKLRIEDFKEKALNPNNNHLTLLGLAYDSGFSSKSVFNTFFKKNEGLTPKAWLKSNQI
ncbi:helix-turn-helix domain-containing protein [Jiulongibacter sediminis]|uniref:AraC family transcriptional regulator n=1 Tax=Jiulongibacter sediminis TaxID=1605367 RepID=A0A0P7C3B3_9BACT|nr:helix-turn-helix domain-containing protein [Jiulongibacter sediminis]KPM47650.1 AraC family transcriptional regulator [Jiulongibacter sediminis]TBX23442.1 AraC family transcriptional regulator [Jiulongibacter sediminis]